ncbi:MAG: MG2 domain-containing protein [Gilvibacter sp.]
MKLLIRSCALLLLFLVVGCNKKSDPKTDSIYLYKDYIATHTSGIVSVASPINVRLVSPLTQYELTQEIPSNILKISPKVAGELVIEDAKNLVFVPKESLKPDTQYTVTLALGKLIDNLPKDLKEYSFSFKTITPNFKVTIGELQSYDKSYQFLQGSIQSADLISSQDAQSLISAMQSDVNLAVKWDAQDEKANYFHFKIDSISRSDDDQTINITWDGDEIGSDHKGKQDFTIPGRNNFKVIAINTSRTPESSIAINFSDPLAPNQNFAGLVTLTEAEDLSFQVDGNMLYVYPSGNLIGSSDLAIFEGLKSTDGFGLKRAVYESISFEQLKPDVKLISKGTILPDSDSNPIYFETVNLSKVDVRIIEVFESNMLQFLQESEINDRYAYELKRVGRRIAKKTIDLQLSAMSDAGSWRAHGLDLTDLFTARPGSLYRVEFSFKPSYSVYDCDENASDSEGEFEEEYYEDDYYEEDYSQASNEIDSDEEDLREQRYWDNELYNWRSYTYNWREQDNPCHAAYYNPDRVATTNVLASNLGLIVKKGENQSYHFAASNLITAKPEASVAISLYNYQQQLIGKVTTEGDGMTLFDSDKTIAFAVAQKGNNYAYVKLADGHALSVSKFDVAGASLQKGLKGFMYTERGVHRPGDSIHLTFVLNDEGNPLPKDHPVKLELKDARGKLVQRNVATNGKDGFYYFPLLTSPESPTGSWNATVKVGGASFSKALQVATIKPNRLKIQLDFQDPILDASAPISGAIMSTWLHGAPARNLKVDMKATLSMASAPFDKFSNYNFTDPVRDFESTEIALLEGQLNEEGNLDFTESLNVGKKAPGMLQASFLTKVYEGGGDFSIDVFSKNLAPYAHFVGLQSPEARKYGSYYTDENTSFDVVSVDAQGKPSGNRELEVKIFEISWRWWWNRGRDNLSRYENTTVHRPVKDFKITTAANGKASFDVNIPEDDGGRYLIRVIDPNSGHATGRVAYFYRNWWSRQVGSDSESAKMLLFNADKESYEVGQEAQISFPSSEGGQALLSIENGAEVISKKWVATTANETKVSIPITELMAPNVYVHISLLQPHEQTVNDRPMRLYGVIPLLVSNPETILHPKIVMPDELKPESDYTITVSEQDKKAMTYTIAVVDEGLLDLTRYGTPKIHSAFYQRQALGVKTFDVYDYVMGAYSSSVDNIYAIGGGGAAAGAKNRKADRFKPVVTYLGPFKLDANETATHTLSMPNYIGSVKAMVIAGNATDQAYGSTDKVVKVRTPLMVLASVPRKLSPGEKLTIPVTVFSMSDQVKSANINLNVGDALKPINGTKKTVSFSGMGEQIVNFEFEVLPTNQFQTIEVLASSGSHSAKYSLEIDVFNPNPMTQNTSMYTIDGNGTKEISFDTFGVAGSNAAAIEVSTIPQINIKRRLEYLIRYPHGCIEQTTSSVFPQLFLADVIDLTTNQKQKITKNLKAAIAKISSFQTPEGGLSYWPGESSVNDWGTTYAGHFMVAAKQNGHALPVSFMSNWIRYQQKTARAYRTNSTSYNSTLQQAYRLYTLALAGQPEMAAMNRLRNANTLNNDAKWRLAAAYALSGNESVAKQIAATATINFDANGYYRYSYGTPLRNKAMALETMTILKDPKMRSMAESVAKELSSNRWLNTQETSYSLLAMAQMVKNNGGSGILIDVTQNGKTQSIQANKSIVQRDVPITIGNNSITLSNKEDNVLYVALVQQGKLPLGNELSASNNMAVTTQFRDSNGDKIDVSSLRQGSDLVANITVTNTSNDHLFDLALTQIFPSGWEIINTSFSASGTGNVSKARYTDIRDDRVNFYFDLRARKSVSFTVKLNASFLGTYYLPGSQVEAMYDASYSARNKGQWIQVEK